MSTRQDISIEQIKEKIRRSLLEKKELYKDLDRNEDSISSSLRPAMFFKNRIINYGLRYKNIINKIPLLGSISNKLYHSLLSGSMQNANPGPSTQEKKNFRSTVRDIPVLGSLIWWAYMLATAPFRITELHSETDGLKSRIDALETMINEPFIGGNTFVVDAQPYITNPESIISDDEDAFYLSFQKVFVAELEVCKKVRQYLPYVLEARKNAKDGEYFLDVGCGRGEFLEILKEVGIPAKGLEINKTEYETLRAKGMDVELSDANEFLEGVKDNTFIGISAVQVVEHLTESYLRKFIELAHKKIILNGVILLETINPKCSFALGHFYLDPTHIRPYPPELLRFLLEWYGFKDINKVYSSLCPAEFRVRNAAEYNYFDCALVGWKKQNNIRNNK